MPVFQSRSAALVRGVGALGLAIGAVFAGASAAEAARRHERAAASSGPVTPEIRTSADNGVPVCVTPQRLMQFLRGQNEALDAKYNDIAAAYQRHGEALHVRWDFAFYQMLLETNYLKFRKGDGSPGDVKPKQNNFAGLGATGNGVPGESFADVSTGVLAQVQHLVAYSGEMVDNPVAVRTRENQDGIVAQSRRLQRAVRFGDLTNRWAADSSYARSIIAVSERFRDGYCKGGDDAPGNSAGNGVTSAAAGKPADAAIVHKAAIAPPTAPRSGLGAVPPTGSSACQVMSASFGGAVTLLIRAETAKGVIFTALDVVGGSEDAQAAAYMASHAPDGRVTGRFKSRTDAVAHAYGLCDSGRP